MPHTASRLACNVVLAASEVVGFAKTGGLADVAGALPRALARRGHDCSIVLPLYHSVRAGSVPIEPTEHAFRVPIRGRSVAGRLWRATLPRSNVPVYLVEQPDYYERDDPARGKGLYQYATPDGQKHDYPDNCERYVFFCRAALEAIRLLRLRPDVLHANDWQTGLIPVYLREVYQRHPEPAVRTRYKGIRTLFTLHNLAYQGVFWHWDMPLTGLDWRLFNYQQLEFHGHLNLLKAGIVFADLLNTVSPMYAREIQTPYYGCGLQGVLAERRESLFGIVNGVDDKVWDPATDTVLAANYDATTVREGKRVCKAALQRQLGLAEEPDTPVLGIIARLVEQKGIDLVIKAAEPLLQEHVQLVVLGEGNPSYHELFQRLAQRWPKQVGLKIGFHEPLAHQIEAGADIFLMPSQYEPAGLNQLYSMRYGTPPVVRAVGGLADTVTDTTPATLAAGTATGFSFLAYTAGGLLEAVHRALMMYRNQPGSWQAVAQNGMRQDWSWDRSALEYEKLYIKLKEME
jgi:starch synthase